MRGTGFYIFAGFLGMPTMRGDFFAEKKFVFGFILRQIIRLKDNPDNSSLV